MNIEAILRTEHPSPCGDLRHPDSAELRVQAADEISPAVAAELRYLNPRLQIEQIREAGHGLHYDQPEQFAAVVKAFLSSLAR